MTTLTMPVMAISRHRMATDGIGVTTLVVSQGCPLSCKWCINPFTWSGDCKAKSYSPETLLDALKIDDLYFRATGGGITFGGGEPLLHAEFIAEFRSLAPKEWKINIETALSIPRENLLAAISAADALIVDIKDMDPRIYEQYTGRSLEIALGNLIAARDILGAENIRVRVPLIPEYNTRAHQQKSAEKLRSLGFSVLDLFDYRVKEQEKT